MQPSPKLTNMLKNFEALRLEAYHITGEKYWTIGYGHNGPDVHPGMKITKTKAEALFKNDLAPATSTVTKLVKVPLNQNQFDTLVSFAFNVGGGNFKSSTLLTMLNKKQYGLVPAQLKRWVYGSNGKILNGLVKRRNQEAALWEGKL